MILNILTLFACTTTSTESETALVPGDAVMAGLVPKASGDGFDFKQFEGVLLADKDAYGKSRCESGSPVQKDFSTNSYVCAGSVIRNPSGMSSSDFKITKFHDKNVELKSLIGNPIDGFTEINYKGYLEKPLLAQDQDFKIFIDEADQPYQNAPMLHKWLDFSDNGSGFYNIVPAKDR